MRWHGFAVGYVAIIIVFAGFGGMLARFSPEAFAGAEDAGIGEWIAFAFFRALAQNQTIRVSSRSRPPRGCSSASR